MEKLDKIAENTGIIPDIYSHLLRAPRKSTDNLDAVKDAVEPITEAVTESVPGNEDIVEAIEDAVGQITKAIANAKPVVVQNTVNSVSSRSNVRSTLVSSYQSSEIRDRALSSEESATKAANSKATERSNTSESIAGRRDSSPLSEPSNANHPEDARSSESSTVSSGDVRSATLHRSTVTVSPAENNNSTDNGSVNSEIESSSADQRSSRASTNTSGTERGENGRFVARSGEAARQVQEERDRRGLLGLLSQFTDTAQRIGGSDNNRDAAGTAVGGVYWGAITEAADAIGGIKDSGIYNRVRNRLSSRDSESDVNDSTSAQEGETTLSNHSAHDDSSTASTQASPAHDGPESLTVPVSNEQGSASNNLEVRGDPTRDRFKERSTSGADNSSAPPTPIADSSLISTAEASQDSGQSAHQRPAKTIRSDSDSQTAKKAKDKRTKRAAIQADKSTVEIEKTVKEIADNQKAGQDKDLRQHKELIETIKDSAKEGPNGLLAALGGMASGLLGRKGGKGGTRNKSRGVGKSKLALIGGALVGGIAAIKNALSSDRSDPGRRRNNAGGVVSTSRNNQRSTTSTVGSNNSRQTQGPSSTRSRASRGLGAIGNIKGLGVISSLLGAFGIAANELDDSLSRKEKTEGNGAAIGRLGAGAVGAAIGTLIFPGVGTVIGGLAGDYFAGDAAQELGRKAGAWFHEADLSSIKDSISANVSAMTGKFKASELGTMLMPRFEAISTELSNAGKGISNLAGSAMTNFTGFVDGLKQSDIATSIKSGFDTFTADLSNAKTTFSDWVAGLSAASIGQSLADATARLSAGFDSTLAEIKSSAFGKTLSEASAKLRADIDETIAGFKASSFGQAVSDISTRLSTAIDATITDIQSIDVSSVLSGISSAATNAATSLSATVDEAINSVKNSQVGKLSSEAVERLSTGLDSIVTEVRGSEFGQRITESVDRLKGSFDSSIESLKNSAIGTAATNAATKITSIIDGVKADIDAVNFSQKLSDTVTNVSDFFSTENLSKKMDSAFSFTSDLKEKALSSIEGFKKTYESIDIKKSVTGALSSANSSVKETTGVDVGAITGAVGGIVSDTGGYLYKKVFGDTSKPAKPATKISEDKLVPNYPETAKWLETDRQERQRSELEHTENRLSMEAEASQSIIKAEKAAHEAKKEKEVTPDKPNFFVSISNKIKEKTGEVYDSLRNPVTSYSGPPVKRKPRKPKQSKLKHWESAKDDLVGAANKVDVDAGILAKITNFESGFNEDARPIARKKSRNKVTGFDGVKAISSAHGYGQFLDGTWKDMLNKHGSKHGVKGAGKLSRKQANAYRTDTKLQAAMLAEFTKENVIRGQRLGGKDDAANVYALHNLGSGDGSKFLKTLKSNPNAPVNSVLSQNVISGNGSLYGKGNITVAQAYAKMGAKMDQGEHFAKEARAAQNGQSAQSIQVQKRGAPANTTAVNAPIKARSVKTPEQVKPEPKKITPGPGMLGAAPSVSADSRLIVAALQKIEVLTKNNNAGSSNKASAAEKTRNKVAPNIPIDIEDAYYQRMEGGMKLT